MCSTSSRRAFFDATDRIAVDTLTESKSGAASIVQTRSMPRDAPTALLRATRERKKERKTTVITSPVSRARQLFETRAIVTVELTMTEKVEFEKTVCLFFVPIQLLGSSARMSRMNEDSLEPGTNR